MEAIESVSGETVVVSGAAEANLLWLTTQVPTREIYLTSGPWMAKAVSEVAIG
jgi:hypothetical protein